MNVIKQIIDHFTLEPMPEEGGVFTRNYLSTDGFLGRDLPARYEGVDHPAGSAIIMLLTDEPDSFSALHRLKTDEVYHYYQGDPLELLLLFPDGEGKTVRLGPNFLEGDLVQIAVPRGTWQGSSVKAGGKYTLFGTTMAPAFVNSDFEIGYRDELCKQFPQFVGRITELTRTEYIKRNLK